ncbi:MAG: hypothetical protein R6U67_05945 [Sodalinema sp.]|uniref:hypothetical protein n=1 Tax=Sodalinema sp. TaxID=3080550 RepID=UPI00121D0611|nr:MAG: hypothetical protein EYR95_03360 [Phormidium sp. SL48-SHIP]
MKINFWRWIAVALLVLTVVISPEPTLAGSCEVQSDIVDFKRVRIQYPVPCFENKLNIGDRLSTIKDYLNGSPQFPVELTRLDYQIIDGGIQLQADAILDLPRQRKVNIILSQDLLLSIRGGRLNLSMGELDVRSPGVPVGLAKSALFRAIKPPLKDLDGTRIDDIIMANGGLALAEQVDLNPQVLEFILEKLQPSINIEIDDNLGLIIDWGFD